MKKLAMIFFITGLLSSCMTAKVTPWESGHTTYGYFFKEYSDQGFLFTPLEHKGKYESIGIIDVVFTPEVRETALSSQEFQKSDETLNYVLLSDPSFKNYLIEKPDPVRLIESAYKDAVKMNADAITNIVIEYFVLDNGPISIPTVKLSGFAIKRLD